MSESQLTADSETEVAFQSEEKQLAARIAEAVGDEPQAAFARRCGISESVMRKYLAGAEPSTLRMVAIADASGVNIAWLAAGRGPKKATAAAEVVAYDLDRLARAVAAVQEGLQALGRTMPPARYAQLVVAAYELLGSPGTTVAQVANFVSAAS